MRKPAGMPRVCLFLALFLLITVSCLAEEEFDVDKIYSNVVVLIDASGSMRPYYTDARSEFVGFLNELINQITSPGDNLTVFLFSRNEPSKGIQSPNLFAEGRINSRALDGTPMSQVLAGINYVAGGNTDLWEAITAAKERLDSSGGGLIWLLTDNIQDPYNVVDQEELDQYYESLRSAPDIQKVHAFPVGRTFPGCTNLPLVYGMVYSKREIGHLLLRNTPVDVNLSVLTQATPIHCKPLDEGMLEVKYPKGTIELDNIEECDPVLKTVNGLRIKSNYPSHRVRSDNIKAVLRLMLSTDRSIPASAMAYEVRPKILNVGSGKTTDQYSIKFNLPAFCPEFSWGSCFKSNFRLEGALTIEADSVAFTLRDDLTQMMDQIYGLRSLPAFFHPMRLRVKSTRLPVVITVDYALWRLFVGLLVPIAIIVLVAAVGYYIWKNPQFYEIIVDGQKQPARKLRWYGERCNVYADEEGRKALVGSLVYKWFRGMFFVVRRPYVALDHKSQSIKLPPKHYEFLVEKDGIRHTIVYRYIPKGGAKTKAKGTKRRRFG
jgi:hypothetical protein